MLNTCPLISMPASSTAENFTTANCSVIRLFLVLSGCDNWSIATTAPTQRKDQEGGNQTTTTYMSCAPSFAEDVQLAPNERSTPAIH
jgi:hypothetical protein